jgi:hypothetical protein
MMKLQEPQTQAAGAAGKRKMQQKKAEGEKSMFRIPEG